MPRSFMLIMPAAAQVVPAGTQVGVGVADAGPHDLQEDLPALGARGRNFQVVDGGVIGEDGECMHCGSTSFSCGNQGIPSS